MLLLVLQCVIRFHDIKQRSIQLRLDGEKQWIFLVQQAQLRKIATNITPISQGRQLFTNWLLSRRLSNRGQGRIANVVTENRNGTKQVVNDTPSTKSRTIILDNEDNNRSSV